MMRPKPAFTLIWILSMPIIFYLGFLLGNYDKESEALVIFANVTGDHIKEVNQLFSALEEKDPEAVLYDFNSQVLMAVGCSAWAKDLNQHDRKEIRLFIEGLESAKNLVAEEDFKKCRETINDLLSSE